MKKIKKMPKKVEKVFTGTQVGMLLEHLNDNIKIVSENLIGTNERIDSFQKEMYEFRNLTMEEFDRINNHLGRIEVDIKAIKHKLDQKADKDWVEKRINSLQKELNSLKAMALKK